MGVLSCLALILVTMVGARRDTKRNDFDGDRNAHPRFQLAGRDIVNMFLGGRLVAVQSLPHHRLVSRNVLRVIQFAWQHT